MTTPFLHRAFPASTSQAHRLGAGVPDQRDVPCRSRARKTPTWEDAIRSYQELHQRHPDQTEFDTFGLSDVGRPLHLFSMGDTQSAQWTLLINNAIHPGEPCGVNACIEWATDLLDGGGLPDDVHIAIVPMYNVGGGLRRNCCTRANQNGPEMYGFRGNARNLDLNRDFIKCDSRNALAFNRHVQRAESRRVH